MWKNAVLGCGALLLVAAPAFAGANFEGTVDKVLVDTVEITAVDGMPEWMQPGQEVQAFGWTAQVKQVAAGSVTLKLSLSKLKNVKPGAPVSIRAPQVPAQDPAQCG